MYYKQLYKLNSGNLLGDNATGTDDYSLTDDITDDSSLIMKVTSAVSIFMCTAVLLTSIFPHLRNKHHIKVVLYINLCNLISSTGSVLGFPKPGSGGCLYQGLATGIFPVASVFWTIVVSFTLFNIVVFNKTFEISYMIHAVCWILPIILTFLPFINATYGSPNVNPGWCFIVSNDENWMYFWFWFSFYGWIWFGILIDLALYIFLLFEVKKIQSIQSKSTVMTIYNRLLIYPFIIIFSWLVVCIRDSIGMLGIDYEFRYLNAVAMLGNALACSQGTFTALYFFRVNSEIFSCWYALLIDRKSLSQISLMNRKISSVVSLLGSQSSSPVVCDSSKFQINHNKSNKVQPVSNFSDEIDPNIGKDQPSLNSLEDTDPNIRSTRSTRKANEILPAEITDI